MKLTRELKTGIIVIAGITLFILGFSYLKTNPFFNDDKTFHAIYDNVYGLKSGTQVAINGQVVGKVLNVTFKDNRFRSVITMTVDPKFDFSKNSVVELYDTGIIGGKGVQIIPAFDNAPPAQTGDTLRASVKPGLTELMQEKLTPLQMKFEGALSSADSVLVHVNDVLDARTRVELRESIAGLHYIISNFKKSSKTFDKLLRDNEQQLDSSLKNVNTLTSNFADLSEELKESELSGTIQGFQKSVENLNDLLAKLGKGKGSLGKLANDEELYDNLSSASKEMELLLQDFRLNPKRYVNVSVFGKKQKEYTLPENDPAEPLKQ